MKIMLVITGLGMGGAEKMVTSLADAFAEKSHEVLLVYLTGQAVLRPKNQDIQIVGFNMTSAMGFFGAYFKLRALISKFKPDVVHSHMVHANLLARLVRLSVYIPKLISTAHNTYEGGKLRMLGYRLTDRLATFSTNVTSEAVEAFEKQGAVSKGRMLIVYNGIDHQKFLPNIIIREKIRDRFQVNSKVVFISVGRLHEAKDYPNLLYAFAKILGRHSNVVLWVIGDGPLRSSLENLVFQLGIKENVIFLGVRDDVANFMNAADVFVLSSAWEGFGLVVAEALATEKVVIATDSGGVKEVLGDCGFLVPVRNSDALASAMQQVLALSKEKQETLGKQGRIRVTDNYCLDSVVEKWLQLYIAENLLP
jgi:glycosyltransferase involved in cell wall biosynthesis